MSRSSPVVDSTDRSRSSNSTVYSNDALYWHFCPRIESLGNQKNIDVNRDRVV